MTIDVHTPTWEAVEVWLRLRRKRCVESLIDGNANCDKLRGEIRLIDDLLAEAKEEPRLEPLPDTDY